MEQVTVTFSGCGDDLVDVSGCPGEDEFGAYCAGSSPSVNAAFVLAGPGGAMKVLAVYDGVWGFAITQMGEDSPLPNWKTEVKVDRGYSADLVVTAPKGVSVAKLEVA